MPSQCFVTAADHRAHWQGLTARAPAVVNAFLWNGPDRRNGQERRQRTDRRDPRADGRRRRLTDRRRRP